MSQLDMAAIKVITTMLAQLQVFNNQISVITSSFQEFFPDVIRKIFVINVPTFIQMLWTLISPCLAKQTQEKIKILGNDWKKVLKVNKLISKSENQPFFQESIGEEVLFEHWGGARKAETEFGNVRMGGKIPPELKYESFQRLF